CITEKKTSLSKLASGVTMYPQVLKNVIVTDKDETMGDAKVQQAVKDAEKFLGDTGRVLLRKSGTEPVLRVMAEAMDQKNAEKAVDDIIDSMKAAGKLVKIK
ncbi:MAG: phosphoglucosamine mutase, partial [Bacillota bacterium]|nr:phosphoglucosamine mutase [Bacillota bacterium]